MVVPEMQEVGVGTREGTKGLGKGPSELPLADKGKGKKKEVVEEEMLQEE